MSPPVRPPLPEAPAAYAAAAFVTGIALGSRSIRGETLALVLSCACGAFVVFRFASRSPRAAALDAAAGLLAAAAFGFALARVEIARPAETARSAFARLPTATSAAGNSQPDRVDRVEGVLTDFWSGDPPHVHGRMRAERVWDGSRWKPFPAEVFLFVSGEEKVAPAADRGDRVVAVGRLRQEGPPVSDRDVSSPWPLFRLSIKSALRIESPRSTWLSLLCAPNRWLFSRFPPPGSLGPGFERDVRGPLAALLLGRTSELDRGMVARYRRGGMYHLLVIAGLHVGLAAALALAILRGLSIHGRRRDAVLVAVVASFVLVGGANPPAVRAGIVFGIFALTRLIERPIAPAQAIGLSALVLFAAAPEQIFAIGTVLTFAAVSGIAAFAPPIRDALPKRPAFFFSGLAAAFAAQIGTAPALLWRFNVVSAGAWLTAPVTVPLAGAMIALGCVLLVLFAAGVPPGPLGPMVWVFAAASRALELFAERMAGMAVLRPTPPLAAAVAVSALLAAGVLARGRSLLRAASWAAAGALFLFLAVRRGPSGPDAGFSLEALDVGQGDALLLRWGRHVLLVDGGGPLDGHARDFGRTRLLPKLLDRGVTRLDAALLTHPHPDHAVGLFAVLEELPVGALWISNGADEGGFHADLVALARERKIPVRALTAGETVRWREAGLTALAVLHSGGERTKRDATNNQSIVARFERAGRSALLTGDAGAAAESELLRSGRSLAADVLKVGHHGSRGSSTAGFLAAVSPRAALVSCGRENRFGHPAPETVGALAERRIRLFRTDLDSDVRIDLLPRSTRVHRRDLP